MAGNEYVLLSMRVALAMLPGPANGNSPPRPARGNERENVWDSTRDKVFEVDHIFEYLVETLRSHGLDALLGTTTSFKIATVCSGIDAPIFALRAIVKAAESLQYGPLVEFEHVFACEIEPFKQTLLWRNSKPRHIFRDVVELSRPGVEEA